MKEREDTVKDCLGDSERQGKPSVVQSMESKRIRHDLIYSMYIWEIE